MEVGPPSSADRGQATNHHDAASVLKARFLRAGMRAKQAGAHGSESEFLRIGT